jgi:hypothetical protein
MIWYQGVRHYIRVIFTIFNGAVMELLSENAIKKLDEMLTTLEPIVGFLNQKIGDKTITGQLDIQRINRLTKAYNEFMATSNE